MMNLHQHMIKINILIHEADQWGLDHQYLQKYRAKIKDLLSQSQCSHPRLVTKAVNNGKATLWICTTCQTEIDAETHENSK